MGETSLKFGPEWLRALSHGGASSPPSSPLPQKLKMAGYRYGREEMLALFSDDLLPPDNNEMLGALFVDNLQIPLTFLPLNAEEQRLFSRGGVNSEAVLRGTGRPPTNGVGRGRGGSVDRGRGRGRGGGIGAPYYSRGISYDEDIDGLRGHIRDAGPPGLSARGKVYDRSQSVNEPRGWNDRGVPERVINPGLEDKAIGMVSPRKEPNRANNENWRSRGVEEVGGDRWSGLSSNRNEKWGPRTTWREREAIAEGEWEDVKLHPNNGGYTRGVRSSWESEREKEMLRRKWEEDNLPEWATESTDDKGGSFDASGAFHGPGYSEEEVVEQSGNNNNTKPPEIKVPPSRPDVNQESNTISYTNEKHILTELKSKLMKKENKNEIENYTTEVNMEEFHPMKNYAHLANGNLSDREHADFIRQHKPESFSMQHEMVKKEKEVEEFDHMRIVADDLVAKLIEDDDTKLVNANIKIHQPSIPPPAGFNVNNNQLPPEDQWFYTDPQGEVQGPFSSEDMAAWYEVGYFKSNLLLRRQCDDKFAQLGDLMRVFGRMPFHPGPAVPPLKVSELIAQKALAHRERLELLQAYQLKYQLYQQQTAIRQQQVLQQLQTLDDWNKLSSNQQQQLVIQQMLSLPLLQAPAVPPALQDMIPPATTASMLTIPSGVHSVKNTRPPMGVPPVSAPSQDPVELLMTQMQSQAAVPISSGGSSSLEVPVQMAAPSTSCVAPEGPLQKLLSQLQKGPGASSLPVAPTLLHSTAKAPPSQPAAEQTDPIKAFLNHMSKRQSSTAMDTAAQDEHKRREDEKRMEAEMKLYEEQQKQKEEKLKQEEIRYLEKIQEERRLQELEEEKLRLQQEQEREEQRKREEIERRMELKRKAEEAKLLEEESRKEQKIRRKQEEEARKKEEAKKREEAARQEAKRKEEERIAEEKRKKEERKQEEERKKKERQAQNQEQLRKQALEEERKRMNKVEPVTKRGNEEQKRAKTAKPTPAAWNSKTVHETTSTPSLVEIQKYQERKDKKEREAESKDQKRLKEATKKAEIEAKRQKELNQGWAGAIQSNKKAQLSQPPVKSLLEIQQEEEKELKKRLKKEQAVKATTISHLSLNAAGVWGSATQSLSWANKASQSVGNICQPITSYPSRSSGVGWATIAQGGNAANSTLNGESSDGFWENPEKISKSQSTTNVSNTAMPSKILSQSALNPNLAVNNKLIKKKNKDDNVKKIFSDNIKTDDGFAYWCSSALATLKVNLSIDIPTFIGFMADVDSPYDVHDYIRSYLGDSKEVRTFARDYLEKRSRAKNALKQSKNDDDILAPAPAVNPTNNQEYQEVNKTKVKKVKKRMQKLDNNLLGFTLPANEQSAENE